MIGTIRSERIRDQIFGVGYEGVDIRLMILRVLWAEYLSWRSFEIIFRPSFSRVEDKVPGEGKKKEFCWTCGHRFYNCDVGNVYLQRLLGRGGIF